MRILLVEDDIVLGGSIKESLHQQDYTVDWLTDGESAKAALQAESFDVVLLDLGLPLILGLDLLKYIRGIKLTLPVIIITARDKTEDKIESFNCGADDFLIKPFECEELCARIRACHRRTVGYATATTLLRAQNVTLSSASHKVTVNNQVINLPRREFAVLEKLLENKNKIVSRKQLMQSLYDWEKLVDSNTLEVYIHHLRRKLHPCRIDTIRGVGYMIGDDKLLA